MPDELARLFAAGATDEARRATMGGGPTGRTNTPGSQLAALMATQLLPEVEARPATDPTSTLRGLYNALVPQTLGDVGLDALFAAVPPAKFSRMRGIVDAMPTKSHPKAEQWRDEYLASLRGPRLPDSGPAPDHAMNHPRASAWNAAEDLRTDAQLERDYMLEALESGDRPAAQRARDARAASLMAARLIRQKLREPR